MAKKLGRHTYRLEKTVSVSAWGSIGGKKEGEGPLGGAFDEIEPDARLGQKTWEQAECRLQLRAVDAACRKAHLMPQELDFILAGDLLNQCVSSAYGLRAFGIPFLGIYGACSTMSEGMVLASLLLEGTDAVRGGVVTSSHFCSAERQFRTPLEYGAQRPPTSQWTATAAGCAILGRQERPPYVRTVTIGTIEDKGITDAANMGAAMAPAAAATLAHFFEDTGTRPEDYDLILTGDLGQVGRDLLYQLAAEQGYRLEGIHQDCGLLLYDRRRQDVHAGASGCGCSASVLCSSILPRIASGALGQVLFLATGALMSTTMLQQGESIPGIAHLVHLSSRNHPERRR